MRAEKKKIGGKKMSEHDSNVKTKLRQRNIFSSD
jgi:hypothetical protein